MSDLDPQTTLSIHYVVRLLAVSDAALEVVRQAAHPHDPDDGTATVSKIALKRLADAVGQLPRKPGG